MTYLINYRYNHIDVITPFFETDSHLNSYEKIVGRFWYWPTFRHFKRLYINSYNYHIQKIALFCNTPPLKYLYMLSSSLLYSISGFNASLSKYILYSGLWSIGYFLNSNFHDSLIAGLVLYLYPLLESSWLLEGLTLFFILSLLDILSSLWFFLSFLNNYLSISLIYSFNLFFFNYISSIRAGGLFI